MSKIYLDPGHGGTDGGASANGLVEKNLTLTIALKTRDILNRDYEGHSIRMSRTTDKTVSLTQRTNDANSWGHITLYPFISTQVAEQVTKIIFIMVVYLVTL